MCHFIFTYQAISVCRTQPGKRINLPVVQRRALLVSTKRKRNSLIVRYQQDINIRATLQRQQGSDCRGTDDRYHGAKHSRIGRHVLTQQKPITKLFSCKLHLKSSVNILLSVQKGFPSVRETFMTLKHNLYASNFLSNARKEKQKVFEGKALYAVKSSGKMDLFDNLRALIKSSVARCQEANSTIFEHTTA